MTDKTSTLPLALIALVVVGGVLRYIVASQDLFADELATYWVVKAHTLPEAVETVSSTAEISPPLGFILSWLMRPISSLLSIDLAPELIRLPALVAGLASIPLVYAVGIRTVGRGAALLAATLTTLSPFMIFYSAEARGYSVVMAFVLLSTLMLLLAVDRGRRGWWVAYAVFACAAAYTHYTAIFVLGAQFLWAFWARPEARKPLLVSSAAAALLYLPWLPSLKGDLDSPTTAILDALSPFTLGSVRTSLSHWAVGFPFSQFASLREMPGIPALTLVAAGTFVGAVRLLTVPRGIGGWVAGRDWQIALVLALAVATPVGEAIQSAVGTNVFSTRSLAPSWPYLALAIASVVVVGKGWVRAGAAALVVAGFAISAVMMTTTDFERPNYRDVARFIDEDRGGVIVDSASVTPGPLANFDVAGSMTDAEVFRLSLPEQKSTPFQLSDPLPDPADLARRAVAAADGEPITVVAPDFAGSIAGRPSGDVVAGEFIDQLPPAYQLAERRLFPGFLDLQALVFEKSPVRGGS